MIHFGKSLRVDREPQPPGELGEFLHLRQRQVQAVLLGEKEPVAAPGHVARDLPAARQFDDRLLRLAIGGNVRDRHRAILMQRHRDHAHRRFDAMLPRLDAPQMRQGHDQADGPVPAHAQEGDVVEEDDPRDAALVARLHQQRPHEHVRAARLVHDRPAKIFVPLAKYPASPPCCRRRAPARRRSPPGSVRRRCGSRSL